MEYLGNKELLTMLKTAFLSLQRHTLHLQVRESALRTDGRGTNGRCSRREVKQIAIIEGKE